MFLLLNLSQYYLWIYRTSVMMVNTLVGMTSPITIPILFSVLSRLQNNDKEFENVFFKFQKLISIIIIIPLGVGIFVYRNLATEIILGDK